MLSNLSRMNTLRSARIAVKKLGRQVRNHSFQSPMAGSRSSLYMGAAGGLLLASLHSATGSQVDFFDYRFEVHKSPDDVASFYGGEEFMELFCIFPFVGQIMMRNGYFDDDGNVITQGVPGTLKVSMVFSDEINETTGQTDWFNKRERFRDICFGYTCWDMVINFGFRTRDDGVVEAYHHGEYFHGNLPIVSQVMKLVFSIHARWVAWATEHHINHYAFENDTEDDNEHEEESRANMPFFLLRNYAWSDLMAMMFGRKLGKPQSFLIADANKKVEVDNGDMDDDKDDDDEDDVDDREAQQDRDDPAVTENDLPVKLLSTRLRIQQDIETDRETTRNLLARRTTGDQEEVVQLLTRKTTSSGFLTEPEAVGHASTRNNDDDNGDNDSSVETTPTTRPVNIYRAATIAAHNRRQSRAATRRDSLQRAATVAAARAKGRQPQ